MKTALKAMEKRKQYVIPGWKNYFLSLLIRYTTRRTAVNEARKYFRPKKRKDDSKTDSSDTTSEGTSSEPEQSEPPRLDESAA